uniref:Carboxylic ester hydrolase n=1 Tax=Cnaphalocrocis medinalis TaxID=437488 RepID=A0A1U9X1V1_CNAME|nr:carboxylesterase [Cnaphalocrocis medinalis]
MMGRAGCVVPILLCLFYGTGGLPRVDPLVETNVGLIRGLRATDGEYSMFLGIPYATVDPANPFGPSTPHPGFETTFEAIDDSSKCPHVEEFNNTLVGSIDCLQLSIFVPTTANSRNRRPVMVWIHGGGFVIGFAGRYAYGPKFFMKQDVILVMMNYRLGPYGFMCLDTPEVPGNQGLKDQLSALRWIKENIEAFGGDSDQITIFGESAGGASVDYHLVYTEEDLFNNVIIQSGTTLSPFSVANSNPNAPFILAEHLGFVTENLDEALQFLSSTDTDLVIAASLALNLQMAPCIEKEFENVEHFATAHPSTMNIPKAKTVPILLGFNNNEQFASFASLPAEVLQNLDPFTDVGNYFNFDDVYLADMVAHIRQFYIGDNDMNENVRQQLANFYGDLYFYHPTYRSIRKYFENGASTIYHYVFSYDGDRNFVKRKVNVTAEGALHADELSYLFDVGLFPETPTPEDQLIIDRITTMWANFAKYRNPTPEITDILPIQWPAITNENLYCLNIDSELTVEKRLFHERMAFWDLFYKLNESYLKVDKEN